MIECLDEVIGGVLKKLRALGLEENTLIFFASDNGGPLNAVVNNGEFQGGKWSVWEGGIRSPLMIQWKGRISGGVEKSWLTNQTDWMPTALAAAGQEPQSDWQLDGVNLLPALEGRSTTPPHDALFWRFGIQYAVRQGDWKLMKASINDQPNLFNLAKDPGEEHDLAASEPARVRDLQTTWDAWNAKNEAPRWEDLRWNGLDQKKESKEKKKASKRAEARK
jgi:arylsulfatase A-like enzyme